MRRRTALAGAALSLAALALAHGIGDGGRPVYDGVCLPPTYVKLGANPPPSSLTKTVGVDVVTSTFEFADNDNSPQAQIIGAAGAVAPPPGASTATVTITPLKPPAATPADGGIDGNVYDFEVTAGGQRLGVQPNHLVTIVLTATAIGGAQREVEHYDGTRWSPVAKTVASGCGSTYQANSTSLGIFALVAQGTGSSSNGSGESPSPGGDRAEAGVGGRSSSWWSSSWWYSAGASRRCASAASAAGVPPVRSEATSAGADAQR